MTPPTTATIASAAGGAISHPWPSGRRRGDAILLAWNYASERGDVEVAAQLMIEYKSITNALPPPLIADRREAPGGMYSALKGLWARYLPGKPETDY
jgi:hypothetical protein